MATGEAEPFMYEAGKSRINPGLDAALMDMRKGEKRIVILPAHLAYGTGGFYAREKRGERRSQFLKEGLIFTQLSTTL